MLSITRQKGYAPYAHCLTVAFNSKYDVYDDLGGDKIMKKRIVLILAALVILPTLAGMAIDLEARIGTGPSLMVTAAWDISSNLSIAASFGASGFASTVQTGSSTVQTPSYTVGIRATYTFLPKTSRIRPYFGIGGNLDFTGGTLTPFLETTLGLRAEITPSIYVLGEASAYFRIPDVADWYWRARLGIGFHLRF